MINCCQTYEKKVITMLLIDKIRELLDAFLGLVHRYVLELIILMFMTLFSLWMFAFLANGLYGYKFDLQSCWGGFSAIGGAGVLAAVKYCTDSWKNSPEGEPPHRFLDINRDGKVDVSDIADKAKDLMKGSK